ncbi:MAG: hypothetical protein ACYCZW_00005, partial [Minisyncoccota bacterium]
MDTSLVVIIIIGLCAFFSTVIFIITRRPKETSDIGLKLVLEQINELSRTVDTKITESGRMMNESVRMQFGESA